MVEREGDRTRSQRMVERESGRSLLQARDGGRQETRMRRWSWAERVLHLMYKRGPAEGCIDRGN
jgi:hypothetical protein